MKQPKIIQILKPEDDDGLNTLLGLADDGCVYFVNARQPKWAFYQVDTFEYADEYDYDEND